MNGSASAPSRMTRSAPSVVPRHRERPPRTRTQNRMTEAATVDVLAALEKNQPVLDEIVAARGVVVGDPDARKKAQNFTASMPADVAAGEADKALALKKGLGL